MLTWSTVITYYADSHLLWIGIRGLRLAVVVIAWINAQERAKLIGERKELAVKREESYQMSFFLSFIFVSIE
jgi:hypothetical protein